MVKSNIIEVEWDSLLIPESLSSEEKEAHLSAVSNYLTNPTSGQSIELDSYEKIIELLMDDSLLQSKELEMDRISNEELFTYFQEDKVEVESDVLFPKIKRINYLFWFLHHLGQETISESIIDIKNREQLSINYYRLTEGAIFFGFLKRAKKDETIYLVPTPQYEDFINQPLEKQYQLFLASLGRNETVSEILQLQLNDPIFDNISRQMAYNILIKDANIKNESLSSDEINQIVNNFRYWYLGIKKAILDN